MKDFGEGSERKEILCDLPDVYVKINIKMKQKKEKEQKSME